MNALPSARRSSSHFRELSSSGILAPPSSSQPSGIYTFRKNTRPTDRPNLSRSSLCCRKDTEPLSPRAPFYIHATPSFFSKPLQRRSISSKPGLGMNPKSCNTTGAASTWVIRLSEYRGGTPRSSDVPQCLPTLRRSYRMVMTPRSLSLSRPQGLSKNPIERRTRIETTRSTMSFSIATLFKGPSDSAPLNKPTGSEKISPTLCVMEEHFERVRLLRTMSSVSQKGLEGSDRSPARCNGESKAGKRGPGAIFGKEARRHGCVLMCHADDLPRRT